MYISGEKLHDFFIGVTLEDVTAAGKPVPGSYPLCMPQFSGAASNGDILYFSCAPNLIGRFVLIQISGPDSVLTLCEVEVYGTGKTLKKIV